MVVSTRQRETHTNVHDVNVFLGNDRLAQLDCLNYLGVKLDANLLWNVQIDELCRKLVFIICRLSRLMHTMARNILMYIYHSIVQLKFDYAITIWGYTSKQNIHRDQRLQNRAARIITSNFDYVNVRGIVIVKQLKWTNIAQRRDYFMALTMFKCIHGISPIYMCNAITMCSDVANRVTRMSDVSNMTVVPPASL